MAKPIEVEHDITISAPADAVYWLIAEVENWPRIFPPTIYVDYVEQGEAEERIRIWATANDAVKNWTSRRTLDPAARHIGFQAEVFTPPVAEMRGDWIIEPVSETECRVRLLHAYRAVDDAPDGLAWIEAAVDRNSRSELAGLKTKVEHEAAGDLLFSFEDTVKIAGEVKDVYDFVNEAGRWEERLPHVMRVDFREDTPGVQVLEMDTRTKDGGTHTTKSVRVCFPDHMIVYKQITVPPLMTVHTGRWTFEETSGGVAATSRHTVVINEANITRILGAGAGVAEAKEFVRTALGRNSLATLDHARAYAESRL